MEEEDKLIERLKRAKLCKRKSNAVKNLRLAAMIPDKKLYVANEENIDIYSVEANDLTFDKTIPGRLELTRSVHPHDILVEPVYRDPGILHEHSPHLPVRRTEAGDPWRA